ncbi:hypothetical protein L211DRAFT_29571 [Terfezia boudieri ATCC MYA-4762]|uniref:Uncharacterized protein n=1 Tax=Terfezia boudieri ATCC MYA-4762 TaxID=1051890 RepID=A0A3N4M3I4_9PEZI|nr:hypothetical protein L211DRAFT_29571 [Terfezia boudieri ATCC MYA-4762]
MVNLNLFIPGRVTPDSLIAKVDRGSAELRKRYGQKDVNSQQENDTNRRRKTIWLLYVCISHMYVHTYMGRIYVS